jgi:hypothetical protein
VFKLLAKYNIASNRELPSCPHNCAELRIGAVALGLGGGEQAGAPKGEFPGCSFVWLVSVSLSHVSTMVLVAGDEDTGRAHDPRRADDRYCRQGYGVVDSRGAVFGMQV